MPAKNTSLTHEIYDLDRLANELPAPPAAYREVILAGVTEDQLIDLGKRFTTEAILKALPPFAGSVVTQEASFTDAQRNLLIGYSKRSVALLVNEGVKLRDMNRNHVERVATKKVPVRRDGLRRVISKGIVLRNSAQRVLANVIAPDTDERRALDAAEGTAESAAPLMRSLNAQAALIRQVRSNATGEHRRVLDEIGVTAHLATELESCAADVDAADRASAAAEPAVRIGQRQLDQQDGVVLHLILDLWRVFRDGAARSQTILVPPLGGILRLANRHPAARKPTPPVPPATG